MWKFIYGLTTIKEGEEDPFEGRKNGEDEDVTKKEKRDNIVEEIEQGDEMATTEEKQIDQCVQDTQLPPLNPPHDTNTPIETIKVKDVPNSLA
jgi:hypothetical protein